MNVINFEKAKKQKSLNKRKVIITIIIIFALVIMGTTLSVYIANVKFRTFFDKYILRKEVQENSVNIIDLAYEDTKSIYAYNNKIVVLSKNILYTYNSSGKEDSKLDVNVSNPIFENSNRFLAIAENKGKNIYLISGNNIVWQKEINGSISKIHVNKNGYISAVILDTTYKNIIVTFDENGKELFTTYLPTTNVIDIEISNDNKYLAFAEIGTSGTLIESKVRVVLIENAEKDPTNSFNYIYEAEKGKLITSIKYQDKNVLVCMYDNDIEVIKEKQSTKITDFEDTKTYFSTIDLHNSVSKVYEKSTGIFTADTQIDFVDVNTKKESIYTASGACKDIYSCDNVIAMNMGAEVHFVSTNGWLVKKYISAQEIKDVVVTSKIAGIVYKDKIEIINL